MRYMKAFIKNMWVVVMLDWSQPSMWFHNISQISRHHRICCDYLNWEMRYDCSAEMRIIAADVLRISTSSFLLIFWTYLCLTKYSLQDLMTVKYGTTTLIHSHVRTSVRESTSWYVFQTQWCLHQVCWMRQYQYHQSIYKSLIEEQDIQLWSLGHFVVKFEYPTVNISEAALHAESRDL